MRVMCVCVCVSVCVCVRRVSTYMYMYMHLPLTAYVQAVCMYVCIMNGFTRFTLASTFSHYYNYVLVFNNNCNNFNNNF